MSSALSKLKDRLRSKMRKKIQAISPARQKSKSLQIFKHVLASDFYQQSGSLLIYVSFKTEVNTQGLIRRALKDGKKVFVPHITGKKMRACRIRNFDRDLKEGAFGILQPHSPDDRDLKNSDFDLVFVPGLAFDEKGGRLGRGAGYFDRYLAKLKKTIKIGLAYKQQVVKTVPLEKHDVCLDFLITD